MAFQDFEQLKANWCMNEIGVRLKTSKKAAELFMKIRASLENCFTQFLSDIPIEKDGFNGIANFVKEFLVDEAKVKDERDHLIISAEIIEGIRSTIQFAMKPRRS
jgi:hypothetical protein